MGARKVSPFSLKKRTFESRQVNLVTLLVEVDTISTVRDVSLWLTSPPLRGV